MSLTKFARKESSVAESQQFFSVPVENIRKDTQVKTPSDELRTIGTSKLNYIITHIDKLISNKFERIGDVADAAELNNFKGYVAGLKDLKKEFEAALMSKGN